MTIFIGADHGGFELKNKLVDYLHEKDIRVDDFGAFEYNAEDDYPDVSKKVSQAVLQNPQDNLGILICRSGAGVSIVANRLPGIRCALGFDIGQVAASRADDHANILALASDYIDFEKAKAMVDAFLSAQKKTEAKYIRRIGKIDESK